jgi:hypothetical protein
MSARGYRAPGEGAIEPGRSMTVAIGERRVIDRDTPREISAIGQMIQCGSGRQIVAAEAVGRQHAGAVDRVADARVLLADNRSNAPAGKPCGHEQAARAAAHNEDVYRIKHSTGAL